MSAGNENARVQEYIDESGWSSMEPEGAGHHPHVVEEFPDTASQDRWEEDFGGQPGGDEEDHLARERRYTGALDRHTHLDEPGGDEGPEMARGPKPVEGDGWGAPG